VRTPSSPRADPWQAVWAIWLEAASGKLPYLETEDVNQALRYAAWLAEEQVLPAEPIAS